MKYILDVWGGDLSQDHLARKVHTSLVAACTQVSREVSAGYLVNIRSEDGDWINDSFDSRPMH